MSEPENSQIGVIVTLKEIYDTVNRIDDKLDREISGIKEEISGLKAQLAAQWVVHGILISAMVFLIQKGLGK